MSPPRFRASPQEVASVLIELSRLHSGRAEAIRARVRAGMSGPLGIGDSISAANSNMLRQEIRARKRFARMLEAWAKSIPDGEALDDDGRIRRLCEEVGRSDLHEKYLALTPD